MTARGYKWRTENKGKAVIVVQRHIISLGVLKIKHDAYFYCLFSAVLSVQYEILFQTASMCSASSCSQVCQLVDRDVSVCLSASLLTRRVSTGHLTFPYLSPGAGGSQV